MEQKKAFKFCPKCTGNLINIKDYLNCVKCGLHFFINPAPANAVLILNDKNEILLIKRKVEPKKGFWDTAGGFILPGESFPDSVKREIKEELDVEITVTRIIGLYPDEYLYQKIIYPTLNVLVIAKIISGNLKAKDDASEYKFFSKDTILQQNLAFPWIKKGLTDYLSEK